MVGTFLSVLGKKEKEITLLISTAAMSSLLLHPANCEEHLDGYAGPCSSCLEAH